MSLKQGNFSFRARTAQNWLWMGKYGTYLELNTSQEGVGVVPSATCSSYISSGHINPSVKDIFQPGTWLLNSQGDYLDASTVPAMDFSFMDTATTRSASTTTSSTVSPAFDNLDPYVPSPPVWATTGTVLLLLLLLGSLGVPLEERSLQQEGWVQTGKETQDRRHQGDLAHTTGQ